MAKLVVFQKPFTRKLTDDNLPGGTSNAIGDYSVATGTPTEFYYQPAVGEIVLIKTLTVRIESSGAIDPVKFIGISALSVGVSIFTSTAPTLGTATFDLTVGSLIKSNSQFQEHFTASDLMGAVAATQKAMSARWDFDQMFDAQGIILNGNKGERLAVYLEEDLSDITSVTHEYTAHGVFLTSQMGSAYIQDDKA
jgi:hypothetical protein